MSEPRLDREKLQEVESLHPELWEILVPNLQAIANRMERRPCPTFWLTSDRATVREAARSIQRLRTALSTRREGEAEPGDAPACEECDEEMHPGNLPDGTDTWGCDTCGWSFDAEEQGT